MSIRALRDAENVFRIEKRCKLCEQAPLSCEGIKCPANQVCVQNSRTCDECASVNCQVDPTIAPPEPSKPNVGAIAGGVIGGILAVAILTFVVWKYCLKGKRRPISQQPEWSHVDVVEQEKDNDFESRRSARASTHTVASMASSVLTRASNIIQIAYIPGVTNRSGNPGSPDLLVPPVPPIPSMSPSSGKSSPYASADQHFFVPDFRDSMMSSSTAGRTSIAPSLAQRGSVASTMYRQNAIVSPLPAQTIVRGKAAVVSVKSTGSTSPGETPTQTPPIPSIDPKHSLKPIRIQMPGISPANSVRSTAQLGPVKALHITKKKSSETTPPKSSSSTTDTERTLVNSPDRRASAGRPLTASSTLSSNDGREHSRARRGSLASDTEDDEDDHTRANQTLLGKSTNRDSDVTEFQDTTPHMDNSPFSDNSSLDNPRPMMSHRITSYDPSSGLRTPMTPIVEESSASKRGSTISNRRDTSPFADTNRSEL
ncbi:hypothetical protein COCMIDRAFT_38455 [Bipolaris oryzae ATCC 44560]|uniref:Membrane anchor Opy2 N-terminal domain-containing protein n=1 Tax=Bipolaris oryzae ATCC 44560 TaxID=930090 RepID=W6Z1Q6_COCMI|nr:uncharacterized protein COCMIDRAFT_38455 [Bipolaris oryzae ATCC 44560]EUC43653.1 hypothetical protein COCMIDRAFT_38455 [Bipolaris oryzae ATCC 44560]